MLDKSQKLQPEEGQLADITEEAADDQDAPDGEGTSPRQVDQDEPDEEGNAEQIDQNEEEGPRKVGAGHPLQAQNTVIKVKQQIDDLINQFFH